MRRLWTLPEPSIEPPQPTKLQERTEDKVARLEEVRKEINHHQYRIDDLQAEEEILLQELRERVCDYD